MKAEVLAKLLKDKGYDIPDDVLAEAQADHKAATAEVTARQESNLAEFTSYLSTVRYELAGSLSVGNFLPASSFLLRGRVGDNGTVTVTVESGHSTGTKRPIHISSDGEVVSEPERNKRDYSKGE